MPATHVDPSVPRQQFEAAVQPLPRSGMHTGAIAEENDGGEDLAEELIDEPLNEADEVVALVLGESVRLDVLPLLEKEELEEVSL